MDPRGDFRGDGATRDVLLPRGGAERAFGDSGSADPTPLTSGVHVNEFFRSLIEPERESAERGGAGESPGAVDVTEGAMLALLPRLKLGDQPSPRARRGRCEAGDRPARRFDAEP